MSQPVKPADRFAVTQDVTDHASHQFFPDYLRIYGEGLLRTKMVDRALRRARFFHIVQMLNLTKGVPGATAEAGVFRGLASFLICNYLKLEDEAFEGETHYMVDSFEGLSKPVEKDGDFPAKRFGEGAFTSTSLETAQESLSDFPKVTIHKGWIPKVLEQLPEQSYRFVHVDVDVYEPTLDCFRYFYPRLSSGGIIMCDDYGPWADNNWPGCIRAVEEFSKEADAPYAVLNTGNVMFVKR